MKKIKKIIKWLNVRNEARKHLQILFETASDELYNDELDFFLELQERGFTLLDIFLFARKRFLYSLNFMREHGLV